MQLSMTTHVDAPPHTLWSVTADIEAWPTMLDSVDAVRITSSGSFGEGSTVRLKQPSMPEMTWTVTAWRPGRQFDWQARVPGTTMVATHRIETDRDGARLTLGVRQYGFLGPLYALLGGNRGRRYVGLELAGLKHTAEQRAHEAA